MELSRSLPTILVIVGPTASGKSLLALELARRMPAEIISADSRQVYQYLTIGTAKPLSDELKKVKHYFVDEILPDQHFSAGEFGADGRKKIDKILKQRKLPIVVGGTGLYIRSLVDGLFSGPAEKKRYAKSWKPAWNPKERKLCLKNYAALTRRRQPKCSRRINGGLFVRWKFFMRPGNRSHNIMVNRSKNNSSTLFCWIAMGKEEAVRKDKFQG